MKRLDYFSEASRLEKFEHLGLRQTSQSWTVNTPWRSQVCNDRQGPCQVTPWTMHVSKQKTPWVGGVQVGGVYFLDGVCIGSRG